MGGRFAIGNCHDGLGHLRSFKYPLTEMLTDGFRMTIETIAKVGVLTIFEEQCASTVCLLRMRCCSRAAAHEDLSRTDVFQDMRCGAECITEFAEVSGYELRWHC